MTFQNHIVALAKKHAIRIEQGTGEGSFAHPSENYIILDGYPIKTSKDYAVAMHEIGHVVEPLAHPKMSEAEALAAASGVTTDFRMGGEIAAWKWARRHVIEWDQEMQRTAQSGLESYANPVRWARFAGTMVKLSGTIEL